MDLLKDLAEARSGKGISQSALADRLGVARLTITRMEFGVGSVPTLLKAMEVLEFRVSGVARGPSLPQQLQARRERLKRTQQEVAGKSGLDPRTIARLENGQGTIRSLLAYLHMLAPRAKKSDPPRASWAFDPRGLDERDKRFTPSWFLSHVTTAFGDISIDPCGHPRSSVVADRTIILPECGLSTAWVGHRLAFVNPPYSAVSKWMTRAADAWDRQEVETIVMLVPARTDSSTFQERVSRDADVLFLGGRIRFGSPHGLAWAAPFSLMVVVWGASDAAIKHFQQLCPSVRMRPWRSGECERRVAAPNAAALTRE